MSLERAVAVLTAYRHHQGEWVVEQWADGPRAVCRTDARGNFTYTPFEAVAVAEKLVRERGEPEAVA